MNELFSLQEINKNILEIVSIRLLSTFLLVKIWNPFFQYEKKIFFQNRSKFTVFNPILFCCCKIFEASDSSILLYLLWALMLTTLFVFQRDWKNRHLLLNKWGYGWSLLHVADSPQSPGCLGPKSWEREVPSLASDRSSWTLMALALDYKNAWLMSQTTHGKEIILFLFHRVYFNSNSFLQNSLESETKGPRFTFLLCEEHKFRGFIQIQTCEASAAWFP